MFRTTTILFLVFIRSYAQVNEENIEEFNTMITGRSFSLFKNLIQYRIMKLIKGEIQKQFPPFVDVEEIKSDYTSYVRSSNDITSLFTAIDKFEFCAYTYKPWKLNTLKCLIRKRLKVSLSNDFCSNYGLKSFKNQIVIARLKKKTNRNFSVPVLILEYLPNNCVKIIILYRKPRLMILSETKKQGKCYFNGVELSSFAVKVEAF
eukprot:GAHX01001613.1.p1 GENE.GAHX01001613.1~~GAHX01001613.1.p1  ORF type:complete len:205 (+),score=24.74 GAHX01001613.1:731-1345(+)